MTAPNYWMHETSGVLVPVIQKYLDGKPLSLEELATMRAYCRQWVNATAWDANPHGLDWLRELRVSVNLITSNETLAEWIERAVDAGMDPL